MAWLSVIMAFGGRGRIADYSEGMVLTGSSKLAMAFSDMHLSHCSMTFGLVRLDYRQLNAVIMIMALQITYL